MLGEPVNLREQQDAVEFFMTLIETLDEALKHLGYPKVQLIPQVTIYSYQRYPRLNTTSY